MDREKRNRDGTTDGDKAPDTGGHTEDTSETGDTSKTEATTNRTKTGRWLRHPPPGIHHPQVCRTTPPLAKVYRTEPDRQTRMGITIFYRNRCG